MFVHVGLHLGPGVESPQRDPVRNLSATSGGTQPTTVITFEQSLNKTLHSNLLVRAKSSLSKWTPLVGHVETSQVGREILGMAATAEGAVSVTSSITASTSDPKGLRCNSMLQSLLAADVNKVSMESKALSQGTRGTKEKRKILAEYEATFRGDNLESIITKKKGKVNGTGVPCNFQTLFSVDRESDYLAYRRMRPSLSKQYRVDDLSFEHVLATVLKEQRQSFSERDLAALMGASTDFRQYVPAILRWMSVDFSPLSEP